MHIKKGQTRLLLPKRTHGIAQVNLVHRKRSGAVKIYHTRMQHLHPIEFERYQHTPCKDPDYPTFFKLERTESKIYMHVWPAPAKRAEIEIWITTMEQI
jgi:hypothetical protein